MNHLNKFEIYIMTTNYIIRHETLRSVIQSVEKFVIDNGYELPECFGDLNYYKSMSYGSTEEYNEAFENTMTQGIAFQIYRSETGNYELNMYLWN